MSDPDPSNPPLDPPVERREFLKSAACAMLGGCAILGPIAAGVTVLVHPLRLKGPPIETKLTTLDALPVGSPPKLFQIITERRDAWTEFPAQAIGAVFLLRKSETEVVAFNASCPHLGCAVEFREEKHSFYCPCHDSSFSQNGDVVGNSPSRRGLDTLEVELRGRDVWVKFFNFKPGIAEKEPVA
jgi:quinol---cytochrome c reductase iron-sulfur subunit, bacillus type